MRVRWTADAADDLERICDYIAQERSDSALKVGRSILEQVSSLNRFPNRGRPGRVEGTGELLLLALPFLAVYEVRADDVQVLRILHGAQRWPVP